MIRLLTLLDLVIVPVTISLSLHSTGDTPSFRLGRFAVKRVMICILEDIMIAICIKKGLLRVNMTVVLVTTSFSQAKLKPAFKVRLLMMLRVSSLVIS